MYINIMYINIMVSQDLLFSQENSSKPFGSPPFFPFSSIESRSLADFFSSYEITTRVNTLKIFSSVMKTLQNQLDHPHSLLPPQKHQEVWRIFNSSYEHTTRMNIQ